jgi:bacteriorhodopsin
MSFFLTSETENINKNTDIKNQIQTPINDKNYDKNDKKKEDKTTYWIKATFVITYILLLTTGAITFIEALRTENPMNRHIFNLETCISLVAGYFYSVFVDQINNLEKEGKPIDWSIITKTRYIDWAITTPIMLLVLCLFLANECKTIIHLTTMLLIVALNYCMLYLGYMGETGQLDRLTACIAGFSAFVALFYVIYNNFIIKGESFNKYFLFTFYVFFWTGYGLVYLIDESWKNIAMNILDCISKCFVGIGLWMYFTGIIPKL